jgi:hypothetical protein
VPEADVGVSLLADDLIDFIMAQQSIQGSQKHWKVSKLF